MFEALFGRCRFPPPGTQVACAVSGGADSLALMVLAIEAGCVVTAVHVDHGLRPGSGAEAGLVAAAAERFGAGFRAERVQVEPGPNLEARARQARLAALPPGAMFGHTADDQAETVLLNMLRGAGIDGLAGIRHDERHPILGLRRAETQDVCRELGLDPVQDPMNLDPSFRRVRVRRELVPLMDDIAERDVVPILARQAEVLRGVAEHLQNSAAHLDPTDAKALAEAPPALARQTVREWLRGRSQDRHPPDAATVERVMAVARGEARATDVGEGWSVRRSAGRLALSHPGAVSGPQ